MKNTQYANDDLNYKLILNKGTCRALVNKWYVNTDQMVNGWYKLLLYKELMTAEQMVRSLSVNDARNFVNTEHSVKTERKRSTNAIGRKQ